MELAFNLKHQLGLVCVILLLPALCTSQNSFTNSRASYYRTPDNYGNPRGACGFGDYGRTVNDGRVTDVSRLLWRDGTGCGACYQVRCKTPEYCDNYGAYVVVTDYGEGDRTDFIMNPRAYSRLGRNANASAVLFKYGVVDVEYERVPCTYAGNNNVLIKIHESSSYPNYLAIVVLYVGGTHDVTAVEFFQDQQWRPMRRSYGAVFDAQNPPRGGPGGIIFRFQVTGSAGPYWVRSRNAVPGHWKAGATYDLEVKFA